MRAAVLLLVCALAGCDRPTGSNAPPQSQDERVAGDAQPATAPAAGPPRRILSAAPSVTEMLCALGLRERMIGRSRYCTYPPEVEAVPVFGDLFDVDPERIVTLRPDLILIAGHSRSQAERFRPLGLRVESLPDASLEDIYTSLALLGVWCDVTPRAEALRGDIERQLAAIDAAHVGSPPRRVLIGIGTLTDPPRPPYVAANGSFYDDLLRRAGHANAAPESLASFAPLALESLLAADPDVIIELAPDAATRPGGDGDALAAWQRVGPLRAVAARRVRVLVGGEHYVPGPRVAQTYAALLTAIDRE